MLADVVVDGEIGEEVCIRQAIELILIIRRNCVKKPVLQLYIVNTYVLTEMRIIISGHVFLLYTRLMFLERRVILPQWLYAP